MTFGARHIQTADCSPDCFGCKAAGIRFSGTCTPGRKPEVVQQIAFDNSMTRDNEAYKRLRKEGLQPKSVKGSADVEQFATSRFEVESGHRLSSPEVGRKYDETQKFLVSGGLAPIGAAGS